MRATKFLAFSGLLWAGWLANMPAMAAQQSQHDTVKASTHSTKKKNEKPLKKTSISKPDAALEKAKTEKWAAGKAGKLPFLLQADSLYQGHDQGSTIAEGSVVIVRPPNRMLADRVIYDQANNQVRAAGHIALADASNMVLFGDYAELNSDFSRGFIAEPRLRLADDSRMAARKATRMDNNTTTLEKVVYSPCLPCEKDPTISPLWQLRASTVIHDQAKQEIIYHNALMEMHGIPIFYSPWFSHPDPGVEQQSGLLRPLAGYKKGLGLFYRQGWYQPLSPSEDMTGTVFVSGNQNPLLGIEHRKRLDNASWEIAGSAVYWNNSLAGPLALPNKDGEFFRYSVMGKGSVELSDEWRAKTEIAKVSDDEYLRTYDFKRRDVLTSRLDAEYLSHHDYASISAISFQDLRPGILQQQPVVLPSLYYSVKDRNSDYIAGDFSVDAGFLSLVRNDGVDTRRLYVQPSWREREILDTGLVWDNQAQWTLASYWLNATQQGSNNTGYSLPVAQTKISYPLSKSLKGGSNWVVEPVAALTLAPQRNLSNNIPNEDSQDIEIGRSNIFSLNRFSGIDRAEDGSRVTYGVDNNWQQGKDNIGLFLGQEFRMSGDTSRPKDSGVKDRVSDLVVEARYRHSDWVDGVYQGRLSPEDGEFLFHDANLMIGRNPYRVWFNYLYANEKADQGITSRRNELRINNEINLTPAWLINVGGTYNFDNSDSGFLKTNIALQYVDECFFIRMESDKDRTLLLDSRQQGTTFFFRVGFKNIGNIKSN
ncbi:MAG: LPS-assembly protein LptD [Alphaproteobacteria bacterium]